MQREEEIVLEMLRVRRMVTVARMDTVRTEEVLRRVGKGRELAGREDRKVLRWFVYAEKTDEYRISRGCRCRWRK